MKSTIEDVRTECSVLQKIREISLEKRAANYRNSIITRIPMSPPLKRQGTLQGSSLLQTMFGIDIHCTRRSASGSAGDSHWEHVGSGNDSSPGIPSASVLLGSGRFASYRTEKIRRRTCHWDQRLLVILTIICTQRRTYRRGQFSCETFSPGAAPAPGGRSSLQIIVDRFSRNLCIS